MNTSFLNEEKDEFPLSIDGVRKWVQREFGILVSKSTVCAVRNKCGADKLEVGAGRVLPVLKSEKEKAVLTAFIALQLFSAINSLS